MLDAIMPGGTSAMTIIEAKKLCDKCIIKQRTLCPHLLSFVNPMTDPERTVMIEALYADNRALFEQEIQNITNSGGNVFSRDLLDEIFENDAQRCIDEPPQLFFISVDPSGGGSSKMGIVVFANAYTYYGPKVVVRDCRQVSVLRPCVLFQPLTRRRRRRFRAL